MTGDGEGLELDDREGAKLRKIEGTVAFPESLLLEFHH